MSSFRRRIGSRPNAALSTGPRTTAGKPRSSRNAIRHGCRSRTPAILLESESRQDFDTLLQVYLSRFQPCNPLERASVDRMAAAQWLKTRLCALETCMLNAAIDSPPPGDDLTTTANAFRTLLSVPGFFVLSRRALRDFQNLRRRKAGRREQPVNPLTGKPEPTLSSAKRDLENKICTNEATLCFLYHESGSRRCPPANSRGQTIVFCGPGRPSGSAGKRRRFLPGEPQCAGGNREKACVVSDKLLEDS